MNVMHSTGRSDRDSWMAENSGWTSAHSLLGLGHGGDLVIGGAGRADRGRGPVATGVRSPGSRPSASNKMVVPTSRHRQAIGASTASSTMAGSRRHASPVEKRVRSERRQLLAGHHPADHVEVGRVDRLTRARSRPSQSPSPRSPGSATPVDPGVRYEADDPPPTAPPGWRTRRRPHVVEPARPVRPPVALPHRGDPRGPRVNHRVPGRAGRPEQECLRAWRSAWPCPGWTAGLDHDPDPGVVPGNRRRPVLVGLGQ